MDASRVLDGSALTRPRVMTALFSGAALMNAAMAVASAMSTIVAGDRLGTRWGAVPNTAGIVGTGVGALTLTWLMNRRGRRAGLALGYALSACGAGIAVAGVSAGDVLALTLGLFLLGLGNAGAQLSRYAAAELYPAHRRGFAISMVVWAGAIGAVGGPLLLDSSGDAAETLGRPAFAGPYLFAVLACLGAMIAAGGAPARRAGPAPAAVRLRDVLRTPAARPALAVMATAQVVMVAVMTAAPLDMHMHGEGLGPVGMTLSAHTLGMFALSPLTGRLLDRLGARPVMLAGLLTLIIATGLAASTPQSQAVPRTVALFLLGYGWNLCFVGGSGRLARDLPDSARASVEGAVDAAVWGVAATSSLVSTMVLATSGYASLAWAASALVVLPAVLLLRTR